MPVDLEKLTEPFPRSAIKQREGGRGRMLDYVEGHTVIRRLNEATGNCWSMEVKDISSREMAGAMLMIARVSLAIPGLGTREGLGVQLVHDRGGEDLVKGCITDALKKAATLFGVGLELYGPDYEAGEIAAAPARGSAPQRSANIRPEQAQRPVAGAGKISERQIRFLHGLARQAGEQDTDTFIHGQAKARYGVDSLHELSNQDASKLIDLFQKRDFIDAVAASHASVDRAAQGQGVLATMPEEPAHVAAAMDRWTQ